MKSLLLIVVLSLLAVGYARDQEAELAIRGGKKGDHTKKGSEGYSHGENFRKWHEIVTKHFFFDN